MTSLRKITLAELRQIKEQGVAVVLAGIVINFIVSLTYTFGNWILYFYLKNNHQNYTFQNLLIIFPLMYIIANLTIPFGQKLINHQRSSLLIFLLLQLLALSYFIISLQTNIYVIGFVLLVLVSPVVGIIYLIPFHCASRYFPSSNNILNGIFQMGQGFGIGLFNVYIYLGTNSENKMLLLNGGDQYHENKLYLQQTLKTISFLIFISSIFIKIYLKYPKFLNTKLLLQYQIAANNYKKINSNSQITQLRQINQPKVQPSQINHFLPSSQCKSLHIGLTSQSFRIIIIMGSTTCCGFLMMTSGKYIGLKILNNDLLLTTSLSISFIFFGSTRILCRKIIQKFGFGKIFIITNILNIININILTFNQSLVFVFFLSQIISIFLYGIYINWFTMYIPKIFGYRLAAKFITIFLIVLGIYNLLIHLIMLKSIWVGLLISQFMIYVSTIGFITIKQDNIWN